MYNTSDLDDITLLMGEIKYLYSHIEDDFFDTNTIEKAGVFHDYRTAQALLFIANRWLFKLIEMLDNFYTNSCEGPSNE